MQWEYLSEFFADGSPDVSWVFYPNDDGIEHITVLVDPDGMFYSFFMDHNYHHTDIGSFSTLDEAKNQSIKFMETIERPQMG